MGPGVELLPTRGIYKSEERYEGGMRFQTVTKGFETYDAQGRDELISFLQKLVGFSTTIRYNVTTFQGFIGEFEHANTITICPLDERRISIKLDSLRALRVLSLDYLVIVNSLLSIRTTSNIYPLTVTVVLRVGRGKQRLLLEFNIHQDQTDAVNSLLPWLRDQ